MKNVGLTIALQVSLFSMAFAGSPNTVPLASPIETIPLENFHPVVSSRSLWCTIGTDGQVHDLWAPAADNWRGRIVEISAFGLIRESDTWLDLRTIDYDRTGSRPGRLVFNCLKKGVSITVTTKRTISYSPIFLSYKFSQPKDFRFCTEIKKATLKSKIRHDEAHGVSLVSTKEVDDLAIGTTPRGKQIAPPKDSNGIIHQADGVREVIVCIHAGQGQVQPNDNESWARAWLRTAGGTEDNEEERNRNRIRINTGLNDLDMLFDASIDGVETMQFGCGISIGGSVRYRTGWIRDGTYSSLGLALAGRHEAVDNFFRFWIRDAGFSAGGENEAQQPAIGIMGMWYHSRLRVDGDEFLEEVFPYVSRYADYYVKRIFSEGMLHTAEEWICNVPSKAAWPNTEIYAGLMSASRIANQLGRLSEAARWLQAARKLQNAILSTAYDQKLQRFIPLAGKSDDTRQPPQEPRRRRHCSHYGPMRDTRVDSGMFMLARPEIFGRNLGVVAVDDLRFATTQAWIHKVLEQPDHAISRFDANPDSLHFATGRWPVWPMSTSWVTQVEWLRGRTDRAWRHLISGIVRKTGVDHAAWMYYLPEKWDLEGNTAGLVPYNTWCHGELLISTILLLLGPDLDVPNADIGLYPSLPPESNAATVEGFRFRGWSLDLKLSRGPEKVKAELTARRRQDENGPPRLRALLGNKLVELNDGQRVVFDGKPLSPTAKPLRCANALERARLYSKILLKRTLPKELEDASVEELETHIRQIEDKFDKELMIKERVRRQREIKDKFLESKSNTQSEFKTSGSQPKAPFKVLYSNDTTNITSCTSPYHKTKELSYNKL